MGILKLTDKDIKIRGQLEYAAGLRKDENPYEEDSKEYKLWYAGWWHSIFRAHVQL